MNPELESSTRFWLRQQRLKIFVLELCLLLSILKDLTARDERSSDYGQRLSFGRRDERIRGERARRLRRRVLHLDQCPRVFDEIPHQRKTVIALVCGVYQAH